MSQMTDKRRRERMLPPKIMLMICRSLLPFQSEEDKRKLQVTIEQFQKALNEPIADLDDRNKERLTRGVQEIADDIFAQLFGRHTATAMRAAVFLMQRMLNEGNADLLNWPAFAEPYQDFAEAIHDDQRNIASLEAVERSARKMSDRQWARLQSLGLYRPRPGQGAAA